MIKKQVRRFYEQLWNARDLEAVPSILCEDFTFRGSLGQTKRGHDGFAEYVDLVHMALADYRCDIEELVAEGEKVFAKMTFTGIHRGEFMGYLPTQRRLSWSGCALFRFSGDLVADLWVLGDLKSLDEQLQRNATGTADCDR